MYELGFPQFFPPNFWSAIPNFCKRNRSDQDPVLGKSSIRLGAKGRSSAAECLCIQPDLPVGTTIFFSFWGYYRNQFLARSIATFLLVYLSLLWSSCSLFLLIPFLLCTTRLEPFHIPKILARPWASNTHSIRSIISHSVIDNDV